MANYHLALDVADFLAQYWQRKHLFVPGGFGDFVVPADGDELAGLAMESEPDSRIVITDGPGWQQEHGPFTRQSYERSGSWTLLVQGVDQYWDEAADLLGAVDFLPSWRLDDIMMSYATHGGSAGPHYDNYDVFIIQGEGQRRWQIGGHCNASSPLMDNTDLRLLADFRGQHEYLMNTGDVLYVPPGIAHYGISIGESTSFSIGFRAPKQSDLLARWADNLLDAIEDDALFTDAAREPASRAGEITALDIDRARAQLLRLLDDRDPRWFGETITTVGTAYNDAGDPISELEDQGTWISRVPASRLAWHATGEELLVFAQGNSREAPLALRDVLEALCGHKELALVDVLDVHDAARGLLCWLHDEGVIIFYD
ncbi:MAG: cupin domain-containing protein [Congregibacter sp.]|nr:cupin domain-containing protein [Congregibacter sp.]